jgi:hypothetical protein
MKKTWYDASFPARFDPGQDMMAWPPDFQRAVQSATERLRQRHPVLALGRVITCETWVTHDSPLFEFPYNIHVSLCWEHPALQ